MIKNKKCGTKQQHIVLQIPQKLCGYLSWTLQFYWYYLFDQFPLTQVIFLSVCTLLFDVTVLSPGNASTRAVALISTCVDMTGISSETCFFFLYPFFYFSVCFQLPLPCCTHVHVPSDALVFPLTPLPHSHSLFVFHSVSLFLSLSHALFFSLCLSPYQGFLINGEPWCLSYQQITLLSINYTDRTGRLQGMDDTHTQNTHSHAH